MSPAGCYTACGCITDYLQYYTILQGLGEDEDANRGTQSLSCVITYHRFVVDRVPIEAVLDKHLLTLEVGNPSMFTGKSIEDNMVISIL